MIDKRTLFLNHMAQTTALPLQLEVDRASGMYIYDKKGKKYFDLNSGICVSSLGHCHPRVVQAVQEQAERYMHTMVYGEHIQDPSVDYARILTSQLPDHLDCIYFQNSGSEAVECALKLARKHTKKYKVVSFKNAYHGSTIAAECLRSDEDFKSAYRPMIPGFSQLTFNDPEQLWEITDETACVVMEVVQAEAGVFRADKGFLRAVAERCKATDTLLIFDEIQTGFGRTGTLFAFEHYGVEPDMLLVGKAMGGGMPISAVVTSKDIMSGFTKNPALGHITTFGGHPVVCAAARAMLTTLLGDDLISEVKEKGSLFKRLLIHPLINEVRGIGLMMAVELVHKRYMKYVVNGCIERGLLVDWFLFNDGAFRLAPPLIITTEQVEDACRQLLQVMDEVLEKTRKK